MKYVVLNQVELDEIIHWAKQDPFQAFYLLHICLTGSICIGSRPSLKEYTIPRQQIDRIEGASQMAKDTRGFYIWDSFLPEWKNRRPSIMENEYID